MLKTSSATLGPPICVTELLQLTTLEIPVEHITWPRVTMTSDQWICIRHNGRSRSKASKLYSKGNTAITVLNPHHSQPQTWEATANCAKMNPVKPVIALRAGLVFQVYNLETRKCLHKYKMTSPVHFWNWVNTTVIAIVTDSCVYHWDIQDSSVPMKQFYRHSRLSDTQLITYISDSTMKWFALTGLIAEDNRVVGVTQLFSVDHGLSQIIEAHSIHFTSYLFKGNTQPSCVLVAATRGNERSGKLHVVELGPQLQGNLSPTFHTETIEFKDLWGQYDFPSSVQVSSCLGLIYVTTKYGLFHLFDLETGAAICSHTICPDIVFTTVLKKDTQGILAVSRNGQVLSIDLKREHLIRYVQEVAKRPHVAERLSHALNNTVT